MKKTVPTRRTTEVKYSVDELMLQIAALLVRDCRRNLDDSSFCSELYLSFISGDIAGVRKFCAEDIDTQDAYRFKAEYQVKNLLKRYRFETDLYTEAQLVDKAIAGFKDTQERLVAFTDFSKLDALTSLVVQNAKRYISRVLGEYSDEEHRSLCSFGRKATIGIPMRKANLAERWECPMSGSADQISWFAVEMRDVECVRNYWDAQLDSDPQKGSIFRETDCLKLALVPKTFKSLRSIMPNTTIGSYQSSGLGNMITKRLKRAGYDITRLQTEHRRLACESSVTQENVTMDLSSASDTISTQLVQHLLPPDWFEALNRARIGQVELPDGTVVQSSTFCTMGIGYTFPLQTLIFLSLLKATSSTVLFAETPLISVYGDDMIFGSKLFNAVEVVFRKLGFLVNVDKTFSEGHFRESCGGDYFAGVDVRPFQPQSGQGSVHAIVYEAVLYKTINGLLRRWSEYEVEGTLRFLVRELNKVTRKILLVPSDFADDAGVKLSGDSVPMFLSAASVVKPKSMGHGMYRFKYLRLAPEYRKEVRHAPYLWEHLRPRVLGSDYQPDFKFRDVPTRPTSSLMNYLESLQADTDRSVWTIQKDPTTVVRSCLTGQRLPKLHTLLPVNGTGRYERQSGTSRFDGRT